MGLHSPGTPRRHSPVFIGEKLGFESATYPAILNSFLLSFGEVPCKKLRVTLPDSHRGSSQQKYFRASLYTELIIAFQVLKSPQLQYIQVGRIKKKLSGNIAENCLTEAIFSIPPF